MFYDYGDVLTVDELMEVLKIGRNSAYSLLKNQQIQSFRVGRIHRIPRENVTAFIIGKNRKPIE